MNEKRAMIRLLLQIWCTSALWMVVAFTLFLTQPVLAAPPSPTQAQRGADYRLQMIDQIGGLTSGVVISGSYAYLATGPRVLAVDVTLPQTPTLAGRSQILGHLVQQLKAGPNALYAQLAGGQVVVLDISHPQSPQVKGSLQLYTNPNAQGNQEAAYALAARDTYLYVAATVTTWSGASSTNLYVVDATNLHAPQLRHIYRTTPTFLSISLAGNALFLAGNEPDVRVLDISQPDRVMELSDYTTSGSLYAVSAVQNAVYAVGSDGHRSGIFVLDAANLTHLTAAGFYSDTLQPARGQLLVHGSKLYVPTMDPALRIFQIAGLSDPQPAPGMPLASAPADMAGVGNHLYLAQSQTGLQILDVSSRPEPTAQGLFEQPPLNRSLDLAGNRLYVASDPASIFVVDIGQPSAPTVVGGTLLAGAAEAVRVANQRIYVAAGTQGLRVLDIDANPLAPLEVGNNMVHPLYSLDVAGEYIYGAAESQGLQIYHSAQGAAPIIVGSNTQWHAAQLRVAGDYAYVANRTDGARVVNVADPQNPVVVAQLPSKLRSLQHQPNPVWDETEVIYLHGSRLYVGVNTISCCLQYSRSGFLQNFDVTNPEKPIWLSSWQAWSGNGGLETMSSQGNLGAVVTLEGLGVVDLSISQPPATLAHTTTGHGVGVVQDGAYLYMTDSQLGLTVWRFPGQTTAQIGPMGGALSVAADQTTYLFPAGIFSETITVVHQPLMAEELPETGDLMWAGHAFDLSSQSVVRIPQLTPLAPFTVTVELSENQSWAIMTETLALYWWAGEQWQPLPDRVLQWSQRRVTATTDQWGRYALLGATRRLYLPILITD